MHFKCLDNNEINVNLYDQNHIDENQMVNYDPENTWISCAGHLESICNEFKICTEILNDIKNSKFPNPVIFLINSIKYISNINNEIYNYISNATTILDKLTASNESDNTDISTTDGFVEHDPGNRIPIKTTLQRQFLISLGPHQPKLAKYPRDINISINKQHHFTSKWFNEFPMLEYSIATDSVFCFVCSLFPKKKLY